MEKLKNIKFVLIYLLMLVYGFFSSLYFPGFLSVALNFTHGVGNNPDGEMLMPFGIVVILLILIIDAFIIIKTIKSTDKTKKEKVLTILIFVSVVIIGLLIDQHGWRNIINCIAHHL